MLLSELKAAGVDCNELPTADQDMQGFAQVHCVKGAVPRPNTGAHQTVTLRVYANAAARAKDLKLIATHQITVVTGPNWTAFPDSDITLAMLQDALGGQVVA